MIKELLGFSRNAAAMLAHPQGDGNKVRCPPRACDEGAMCPHAMQVALATARIGELRTPTEGMADCVVYDLGWLTEEWQNRSSDWIEASLPSPSGQRVRSARR